MPEPYGTWKIREHFTSITEFYNQLFEFNILDKDVTLYDTLPLPKTKRLFFVVVVQVKAVRYKIEKSRIFLWIH